MNILRFIEGRVAKMIENNKRNTVLCSNRELEKIKSDAKNFHTNQRFNNIPSGLRTTNQHMNILRSNGSPVQNVTHKDDKNELKNAEIQGRDIHAKKTLSDNLENEKKEDEDADRVAKGPHINIRDSSASAKSHFKAPLILFNPRSSEFFIAVDVAFKELFPDKKSFISDF